MLKLLTFLCCFGISIFYYSMCDDKKDVAMAIEFLKITEGGQVSESSVNHLLKNASISYKMDFDPKTHQSFKVYFLRHRD